MADVVSGKIELDAERCNGCALCAYHCIHSCIAIGTSRNADGYRLPLFDESTCTSCGICAWVCPQLAIVVYASAS